jgi:hypothetical protein
MEKTQLLLEYLKEQYSQARQHETLRTNVTTFLTAAAGVVLGILFKEGKPVPELWWGGLIVASLGAANLIINKAHFLGNRFHTSMAGKTRRAIEATIQDWSNDKPSLIRAETLRDYGLKGEDVSLGKSIQSAIQIVPFGVMLLGFIIAGMLGLPQLASFLQLK